VDKRTNNIIGIGVREPTASGRIQITFCPAFYIHDTQLNNMAKEDKSRTKISIETKLANKLKSMMTVGETYSTVIWRLLEEKNK
jgi:hypothetical protein